MREDNALNLLERGSNRLSFAINDLGSGVLALMMFLVGIDVVLRYIFNRPIAGSYEIVQFMLVIVVFFGMANTAVHNGHIRVDIFITHLTPKVQDVIDTITYLCCIYF